MNYNKFKLHIFLILILSTIAVSETHPSGLPMDSAYILFKQGKFSEAGIAVDKILVKPRKTPVLVCVRNKYNKSGRSKHVQSPSLKTVSVSRHKGICVPFLASIFFTMRFVNLISFIVLITVFV